MRELNFTDFRSKLQQLSMLLCFVKIQNRVKIPEVSILVLLKFLLIYPHEVC